MDIGAKILAAIEGEIVGNQREPDDKLHCSSDICGCIRQAQLRCAGISSDGIDRDFAGSFASSAPMTTGTMWHELIASAVTNNFRYVHTEIVVDSGLPAGWTGTADALVTDTLNSPFTLVDFKTTKGEGIQYIEKDGAKKEHIMQISAYYHALADMGFSLAEEALVLYLPMNAVPRSVVRPSLQWVSPVNETVLFSDMKGKTFDVSAYCRTYEETGLILNDALHGPMDMEQKMFWSSKLNAWEVKIVSPWQTQYCPYDPPLCACSDRGTEKIGEFHKTVWKPRSGYSIEPTVHPTVADLRERY